MMARTYYGLGPPDIAVRAFERLTPWVVELLAMQSECRPMGPDYMAMGVAWPAGMTDSEIKRLANLYRN